MGPCGWVGGVAYSMALCSCGRMAPTGRKRGRCSFEGCGNEAEVGGHVQIARTGCVIAPICKPCNNPNNQNRMQGAGARLRKNIEVTRTPMTWGMRTAVRRVPDAMLRRSKKQQRRKRQCISCNDDISKRPVSHTHNATGAGPVGIELPGARTTTRSTRASRRA